jgi:hypothetical protein
MTYAKGTEVSIEKSEAELKAVLRRYKAGAIGILEGNGQVQLVFEMSDRRIMMRLPMPRRDDKAFKYQARGQPYPPAKIEQRWEQACRERWRALLLCVKAKLESVESGIETFDQAFLAHVMLPTGETVGEWATHSLPAALEGLPMPPLLPGPPQ